MTAPLDHAWNYPLFEALYGRRSRRFGLGFEMPEGPFRYKSAHAPVPLSEIEEALLLGAGAGFSGLAFWDLPTSTHYPHSQPRVSGRTFPVTRPGGHTSLFWTNDDGFYVLDDKVEPTRLREIKTADERGKLLDIYRAQRRTLGPAGLDAVSAGLRCERRGDLIDRTVRRSGAAPLCACKRRLQYRRRPARLST